MVERLVAPGADFFRDRGPPFLSVGEFRIDVEDHASERKQPVLDHLADAELGESHVHDKHKNAPSQLIRR